MAIVDALGKRLNGLRNMTSVALALQRHHRPLVIQRLNPPDAARLDRAASGGMIY